MTAGKIDEQDLILLEVLQRKGRTTRGELAKAIGKSIPIVSKRMQKLEDAGVITGYHTHVSAYKLGFGVMAFVILQVDSSNDYEGIIEEASKVPHILECHALTGEGSHLLKVYAQDTSKLEELLSSIQSWPGVKNTRTNIVLSSPKDTTCLPLIKG